MNSHAGVDPGNQRCAVRAAGAEDNGKDGSKDRNFVIALARGFEVLRAFKPTDGMLGNQEIAARTKLPKPTVSRLTYTLTRLGYLTHLARLEKFQLAPALGYAALAHTGIRRVARPFMQQLADDTGGSVALGCRDRLIYIGHCCSDAAVTVHLDLGSRIPNADTAIGRALITALPEAERQDVPLFKPPIASRFDENIRLSSDLANRLSKNQH